MRCGMGEDDIHHITREDNCALARFWKDHPEYRIDPAAPIGPKNTCYGRNLGFDYAHAAVRERRRPVRVSPVRAQEREKRRQRAGRREAGPLAARLPH